MNASRNRRAALVMSLGLALLLVLVPVVRADSAGDAQYAKLQKALGAVNAATYQLTLQNRVGSKMRPKETISCKTTREGKLYLKWTGDANKNRELIYKPGWNNDRLWVKEGGALDFAAVAVAFDDPIVKADYVRSLDVLIFDRLAKVIAEWKSAGEATVEPDGNTLKIAGAAGVALITMDAAGLPAKIVVKDAKDQLVEEYVISNLNASAQLGDTDFDVKNSTYGFPGFSSDGIYIDAERMKATLDKKYGAASHYTCRMEKKERIGGKLQEKQTMDVKFRKPGDIYMKWGKGPHEGRQMLYRVGKDDKITVKEAGILGIATVRIDPNGSLVKADTNHPLTELDMGFTIGMIYQQLSKGQKNGDIKLKFKGVENIGGKPAYVVESWFQNVETQGYYAPHSINWHDKATGLPVKTASFEANGDLREEFVWTNIKFNPGLTDADWDPANPAYGF